MVYGANTEGVCQVLCHHVILPRAAPCSMSSSSVRGSSMTIEPKPINTMRFRPVEEEDGDGGNDDDGNGNDVDDDGGGNDDDGIDDDVAAGRLDKGLERQSSSAKNVRSSGGICGGVA